jgi:arylsulfatase A-like enzyme
MFSGLLPRATGLPGPDPQNMAEQTRGTLPALADRWLPAVMSAAGYQTAGVSTNPQVSAATGFDMGFDSFSHVDSPRCGAMTNPSAGGRVEWALQALRATLDDGAAGVADLLTKWLAAPQRRPFFWFVNLIECHSPYMPPRPHNPLGPVARLRAAADARVYLTQMRLWRASAGGFDIPADAIERMRALYGGSIRAADSWLARVLEDLDRHGLLDETIVIVTADHGENLGEGNLIGHVFSLDDRLIRVPLVVSGPAAALPGPRFSLVNLAGWLAASCELPDPPWAAPASEEIAVAEFRAPGEPGDPRAGLVAAAWGLGDVAIERLTTSLACATDGQRKLVRRGDREELFELGRDPLETAPVSASRDDAELAPLRAALDQAAAQRPTEPSARAPATFSDEEQARLEASLRALGYL